MAFNSLDECDDATWFMGAFRSDSPDAPDDSATWESDLNDWSFDTRFAWLPYYDEPSDGRYLIHLGVSYSYRNRGNPAKFSTNAYMGDQAPIGLGALAGSDEYNQVGAEFAIIWGSLSVAVGVLSRLHGQRRAVLRRVCSGVVLPDRRIPRL